MKKLSAFYILVSLLATASSTILFPNTAFAIDFDEVGETLGLGEADLEESVIKMIQWLLGLMGLMGVIMVIYGGFMWMTAGGSEEKISKAKKIISAAIIGMVVVMLAWAIVSFSMNTLVNVTDMT